MNTYNIYKHPFFGIEAVKIGFSWPGFLFGICWMLAKKLWVLAGLWFIVLFVLTAFDMTFIGYFIINIIFGVWGNTWKETNLSRRGYEQIASIQAETQDAALAQVAKEPPNTAG